MGAWGFGSDENDDTYDKLGLGIMERLHGVTINAASKEIFYLELQKEEEGALDSIGVIVWLVKEGAVVPVPALEKTVKKLEAEDPETDGSWCDGGSGRKAEIVKELALLKQAIEAGGQINATATRGIAGDRSI